MAATNRAAGRPRMFYGWWIVILSSVIMGVGMGIISRGFAVLFLPLQRDLALSAASVSIFYSAARLEGGFEGPIVGALINRFGSRKMVIAGVCLTAIGLLLLATVHSFWTFFFVYTFIVSVGYNAGFFHPLSAAITNWFVRRRATGFAVITSAGSIGGMIFTPPLAYLVLNHGWRAGAIVSGLVIFAISIPAAIKIYSTPESRGLLPDGVSAESQPAAKVKGAKVEDGRPDLTWRVAVKTWSFWLLGLSICLRVLVTVALNIHIVPLLVWRGMSEEAAAYMVSLFSLVSVVAMLGMGWWGDRWSKTGLCAVAGLPLLVGLLGMALTDNAVFLYAFPVVLGLAMGTAPLNWSLVGDFFGRRSYATLRGIMGAVYCIPAFLAPVYAGWSFDQTGSYSTSLIIFAVILLVGAFMFVVLPRPKAPQPQSG